MMIRNISDSAGKPISSIAFQAEKCHLGKEFSRKSIEIEKISRRKDQHLIVSYNINGQGDRASKINHARIQIRETYGVDPTAILLQEVRRPIMPSHIPDYKVYQRFACEFDEKYSTKIQKPGTGNAILIRDGISFNQLEFACWDDQISTIIIF